MFAENPTAADFKQIFDRCCRERGVDYDEAIVDRLVTQYFSQRGIALRGCQPRDLIEHALALADYLGEPRQLTDRAAATARATAISSTTRWRRRPLD